MPPATSFYVSVAMNPTTAPGTEGPALLMSSNDKSYYILPFSEESDIGPEPQLIGQLWPRGQGV